MTQSQMHDSIPYKGRNFSLLFAAA